MAKVNYAWSNELNRELTASEAHEAWVMGEMQDKTAFECRDTNCHAQITCVNMDKQEYQMKMREHFKVFGEHSEQCKEKIKHNEVTKKKTNGRGQSAPTIGEDVTFHMIRPKKHSEVDTIELIDKEAEGDTYKKGKSSNTNGSEAGARRSNLFLLSTLVSKYIGAWKKGELDVTPVTMILAGKSYQYSMRTLFVDIQETKYAENEAWKTKVYFGKAVISKNNNGEFWVNFLVGFQETQKDVKCVIKQKVMDNTHNRTGAINILERFSNQEIYCFALGTIKDTDKTFYINIESLEHFACTQEDIKNLDDVSEE